MKSFILAIACIICLASPLLADDFTEVSLSFDPADITYARFQDYDILGMQDCYIPSGDGQPALPVHIVHIAVPQGAEITRVEYDIPACRPVPGHYFILPAQPEQPLPLRGKKMPAAPFVEPQPGIYQSNRCYPQHTVISGKQGSLGGYNIASVLVYPLRYRPLTRQVELHTRIDVRVFYAYTGQAQRINQRLMAHYRQRAAGLVVNSDALSQLAPIGHSGQKDSLLKDDAYDYVIISPQDWISHYQPLADWRNRMGFRSTIVSYENILSTYPGTDDPDKLRHFIIDAWQNWGALYFLIGGDEDVIDTRIAWYMTCGVGYYSDEDYIPCDHYFSDLDGDWNANGNTKYGETGDNVDLYADVYVGRCNADNTDEIDTFVQKTLWYEKTPNADMTGKIMLIGELLFSWYDYWGDVVNNAIEDVLPAGWETYKVYESLGNYSLSNIIAGFNSGNDCGHWACHGNETGVGPMDTSDISSLSNGNALAFHNQISCFCGAMDYPHNGSHCYAEAMVLTPDKGLAAMLANTRYGWGDPPNMGPSELLDVKFYEYLVAHPSEGAAQLNARSKDYYVPTVNSSTYMRWCMYELMLFGDPLFMVHRDQVQDLVVSHPGAIMTGQASITVDVATAKGPVEAARVCLLQDGTLFATALTDASGQATIDSADAIPGEAQLTVTSTIGYPYETTIDVITPSGPYLTYGSHTILSDDNSDGKLNPGETVSFKVVLENVGVDAAQGVQVSLSTDSPYLSISQGTSAFPDIPADQSRESVSAYVVQIADTVPDQASIKLYLDWATTNKTGGQTFFRETLHAPTLSLAGYTLSGGNGDDILDPGETVDVLVTLDNTGSGQAQSVALELYSQHQDITVDAGLATFGDIPGTTSATNAAGQLTISASAAIQTGDRIMLPVKLTTSGHLYDYALISLVVGGDSPTEYPSADVPKPVTDYTVTTSEVTVSDAIRITGVRVYVDISHTYRGDLTINIVSPHGSDVLLKDTGYDSANNVIGWYPTDMTPEGDLATFVGEEGQGTWTLVVEDHWGSDEGTLNNWSVEITGYNEATFAAQSLYLPYMENTATFRSNIGIVNTGNQPAPYNIRVYSETGGFLRDYTSVCGSQCYTALANVLDTLGISQEAASIVVQRAGDSLQVIGGPVDNTTSDPCVQQGLAQAMTSGVVPIVLKNSTWNTRLAVFNPGDATASVTLSFYDHAGGSTPDAQHTFSLGACCCQTYDDIITTLGLASGDYGICLLDSTQPVVAYSHQYTGSHTGGIYPVVPCASLAGGYTMPYVMDTATYRSNIGIANPGAQAVDVTLSFYRDGALDSQRTTTVPAKGYLSLINVIRWIRDTTGCQNSDGYVEISGTGSFMVIGGPTDNSTNDPSVVSGFASGFQQGLVPIVISAGTWQSRMAIVNPGATSTTVTFTACNPANGSAVATDTIVIPAKSIYVTDNIVQALGLSQGWYGSLQIEATADVFGFTMQYTAYGTGGIYPIF